jgi:gamma-glutamylcyclotransferase (GGCT)/AIG2-like uncharacterized protein YtfP
MRHKVFVYGTLRPKGAQATHVLYDYAMYNYYDKFPYITASFGNDDDCVYGNVLSVSKAQLDRLDEIEGVARGLYSRETVEIKDIETKEMMTAFVYVGQEIVPALITSGDWLDRSGV